MLWDIFLKKAPKRLPEKFNHKETSTDLESFEYIDSMDRFPFQESRLDANDVFKLTE